MRWRLRSRDLIDSSPRMRFFRLLLLLILALANVSLGGLGGQAVLCIEPDGHVGVESVGALCCGESDAGPERERHPLHGEGAPTVGSADCCACIDVPLHGGESSTTEKAEVVIHAAVAVVAAIDLAQSVVFLPAILLRGGEAITPPSRIHGRSSRRC